MNPIISVIVPVYNVENFIQKSIKSLINQTFKDFEVLVVDDGSTDKSIAIAKKTVNNDKRFIFLEKENGGLSDARNFGIEKAKGKYLAFLDSDDFFDKTYLEQMYMKIIKEDADICICDIELVKEDGSYIRTQKNRYQNTISGFEAFIDDIQTISIISMAPNKLYKKELFQDIQYPKGWYYEDRATTYKLFLNSKKISFVNKSLFYYLQREGSIMNGLSQKKIDDKFAVINSIKEYLLKKNIFSKYQKEFMVCYLLNVPLAGAVQIAMYSDNYNQQISEYILRVDKDYFTFKNILLLRKNHLKKMFALLLLKLNKKFFKYLAVKEKEKSF